LDVTREVLCFFDPGNHHQRGPLKVTNQRGKEERAGRLGDGDGSARVQQGRDVLIGKEVEQRSRCGKETTPQE
jgi:hypothetical protein